MPPDLVIVLTGCRGGALRDAVLGKISPVFSNRFASSNSRRKFNGRGDAPLAIFDSFFIPLLISKLLSRPSCTPLY